MRWWQVRDESLQSQGGNLDSPSWSGYQLCVHHMLLSEVAEAFYEQKSFFLLVSLALTGCITPLRTSIALIYFYFLL